VSIKKLGWACCSYRNTLPRLRTFTIKDFEHIFFINNLLALPHFLYCSSPTTHHFSIMHSSDAYKTPNYSSNNKGETIFCIFIGKWKSGDLGSVARSGTDFLCVLGQFACIKIFQCCQESCKPTVGLASRTKPHRTMDFFQKHWIPITSACFCRCIQHFWRAALHTKVGPQSVELQNGELIPL